MSCLRPSFRTLLPLLAGTLLTGCYDTKQEITLNPDGSGKVVFESILSFSQFQLQSGQGQPQAGENFTNDIVRRLVERAEGVDAWRDLAVKELDDGSVSVSGTAYFPDLSRLKTEVTSLVGFKTSRERTGSLSIQLNVDTSKSPVALPAETKPVTRQSIQQERREFRAMKAWLAATFGTMKLETTFHLPAPAQQVSNFETNGPRSLRLRMDGQRFLALVESVVFDEEYARRRLAGSTEKYFDEAFVALANEKLYGQRGPVKAVVAANGKAQFDYATEVAAARESFPEQARSLGVNFDPKQPVQAAVDGAPARIRVSGIQWQFESETSGLTPAPGYTLNVRADLPGPMLAVKRIEVTRAATLEGRQLTLHRAARLSVQQPGDRVTGVTFNIQLGQMPLDSAGLAEVSGYLECEQAENQREVELVSGKLRSGARGAEFDSEIESLASNVRGGDKLVLRTRLPSERMLSVRVISESGQSVTLTNRGAMTVGDQFSYAWATTTPLPRTGRIVAELRDGMRLVRVPFSITNVSLLAQPLAAR